MKILHIITGLHTGGAELTLHKLLAAGLHAGGPQAEVISLRSPPGPVATLIEELGIPVTDAGVNSAAAALKALPRLRNRVRAAAPDIVQTWMAHANLLGGLAARAAGNIPVIWGLRQSRLDPAMDKLATRAVLRLGACLSHSIPRRIVCASEAARRAHAAMGYDTARMIVIPNGFDLDLYRPDAGARASLRDELGLASDTPLVGLIARVDPYKDHANFFAAAAIVVHGRPDCAFVLAGDGATLDNAEFTRLIAANGLAGHVHLLGLRRDVARLTAALDVAVSSSACGEAFSNTLGEALASGVVIAATDVGNAAELVGCEGRIVAPRDAGALGAAISELLSLPASERTAMGTRGRARMERDFGLPAIATRWRALYDEMTR